MKNIISYSIIIVNYNSAAYLRNCLNSIFKYTPQENFEIIVFDNHSQDKTADLVAEFPNVKFIFHHKNVGFATANNLALQHCSGEYILILNPDTEINSNIFTKLLAATEKYPDSAFGVKIKREDGSTQISTGNFPSLKNMLKNQLLKLLTSAKLLGIYHLCNLQKFFRPGQLFQDHKLWDAGKSQTVDWISGAFLFVKKDLFIKAGMFNPEYFLFAEDMDLGKRFRNAGVDCIYLTNIEILHIGSVTLRDKPLKNKIMRQNAMVKYYFFNRSKFEFHVFRLLMSGKYFFKSLLTFLLLLSKKNKRKLAIEEAILQFSLGTQLLFNRELD